MRAVLILILLNSILFGSLATLSRATGPSNKNSSQGFEKVYNQFTQDYQRSSAPLDDALDEHVNIGFNFPFNGKIYNELIISSNGVIYFRDGGAFSNNFQRSIAAHYSNKKLSTNSGFNYAMENAIYVYWDDLNLYRGGKIKYGNVGSGDGKHFVVSWEKVPHFNKSGSYSFQVALYKDGTIIFRYDKNSDANGDSIDGATIGVKEDSNSYDQYSYNSKINQSRDVVYRLKKSLSSISALCKNPKRKITMTTYNNNNRYPNDWYEFENLRQSNTSLIGSGYVDSIDGSGNPYGRDDKYWSHFDGYLYMPQSGRYKIGVDGDDSVEVYIDNKLITGWYGGHGRANKAEYLIEVNVEAGYHKIDFYQEENYGGDNYYLYWQLPNGSIQKVPKQYFYHCEPEIVKSSCVISDPINNTTNPKRIPGAKIRYALGVKNYKNISIDNAKLKDRIDESKFDKGSISNIFISDGSCNCKNPTNLNANGINGSKNGENPIILDFGTIASQGQKCGYFEVNLK